MVYVFVGPPIALARHRFSAKGSIYDSQKDLKRSLAISLASQHDDRPLYKGPLELTIRFIFPHRGQNKKSKPYWHNQRPDADNCLKLVCDVGNGILWEDDKSICKISLVKVFGDDERTEFMVNELEDVKEDDDEQDEKD